MSISRLPERTTTAEFLRWEGDGSDTRYELVDGQLVAMSPTTSTYGRIQANVALLLGKHLEATRCSPHRGRRLATYGG